MAYIVFKVEKDKVGTAKKIMSDNMLSRQSLTIREAGALGLSGDEAYFMFEGPEEALEKAKEMFKTEDAGTLLPDDEIEKIHQLIEEQENASMAGMGAIFG